MDFFSITTFNNVCTLRTLIASIQEVTHVIIRQVKSNIIEVNNK